MDNPAVEPAPAPQAPRGVFARISGELGEEIGALLLNLWGGLRLILPVPIRRMPFRFGIDRLAMLMIVCFAIELGVGYAERGPHPHFWPYQLGVISALLLALLAACYTIARFNKVPGGLVASGVALLATGIVVRLGLMFLFVVSQYLDGYWIFDQGQNGYFGPRGLVPMHWAIFAAVGLLSLTIIGRAIRLTLCISRWRAALSGIGALIYLIAAQMLLPPGPLWYSIPDEAEAAEAPHLDIETVYYDQGRLLRQATASLASHRAGTPELYFLGFAAWARQDVFLKEGRYVRHLFDQRFGTDDGRSALLANNRSTVRTLPLASVNNLSIMLRAIAAKMDVENDVLFLSLTSHGSPGLFAVDFDGLGLNNLTPDRLRHMLDASGIKWRVIVVSACYSGSFVDALKDDRTLVITAARKDRTSFGCSSENDFTYFGEAYFVQALQHTYSFIDAFDEAKQIIAAREESEKLTPSEPQISVGDAIRPKLAALAQRLSSQTAGP